MKFLLIVSSCTAGSLITMLLVLGALERNVNAQRMVAISAITGIGGGVLAAAMQSTIGKSKAQAQTSDERTALIVQLSRTDLDSQELQPVINRLAEIDARKSVNAGFPVPQNQRTRLNT